MGQPGGDPLDIRRAIEAIVGAARGTREAVRRELERDSLGERLSRGTRDLVQRLGPFAVAIAEWFEGEFKRPCPPTGSHSPCTVPDFS